MDDEKTIQLGFMSAKQRDFALYALESLLWWLVRRRDTIARTFPSGWVPLEILGAIETTSMVQNKLRQHQVGIPTGLPYRADSAYMLSLSDFRILRLALENHIESI